MHSFIKFMLMCFLVCSFFPDLKAQADKKLIKPTDTNIVYTGRIDFSNAMKPTFSYPGVSIKTLFTGTTIDVVLEDQGDGGDKTTNYFNVIIDKQVVKVLKLLPGKNHYSVIHELKDSIHEIELFKRTESQVGKCVFHGFKLPINQKLIKPLEAHKLKFEFIGDSFTAGYGNDTNYIKGNNSGFHAKHENNYLAWGAIVCRNLNLEYVCTAYSGRGLYRNNTGAETNTMPLVYDLVFPDELDGPLWQHDLYIPDFTIISLGANDFYLESGNPPQPVDSMKFVNTYINFIKKLKNLYPKTKIVCIVPSSISNNWPPNLYLRNKFIRLVDEVVVQSNKVGIGVYQFTHTLQKPPYGEDWHASVKTHQVMADEFMSFIRPLLLK